MTKILVSDDKSLFEEMLPLVILDMLKKNKIMKLINHHSIMASTAMKAFFSIALIAFLAGCSDDAQLSTRQKDATGQDIDSESNGGRYGKGKKNKSLSSPGDYTISLSTDGYTWTYLIKKNSGAKNLSHFVLNFQNCGAKSATVKNILWATVNGKKVHFDHDDDDDDSSSRNSKNDDDKKNDICGIAAVTTNFVKFDNLKDADCYTIVFRTNKKFGNFVGTTAWLKAGNSCFAYSVLAPCCPL